MISAFLLFVRGVWTFILDNWKPIAIVLLVVGAFKFGQRVTSFKYELELASIRADAADDLADAHAAARKKEAESQARVDQAEAKNVERTQVIEARERAAVPVSSGLRNAVAAAKHRAAEDTGTACAPDVPALWIELVGELNAMAEESARTADRYAEQITGLQDYIKAIQQ